MMLKGVMVMFNLKAVLQQALTTAAHTDDKGTTLGSIHRNRSTTFVEAVAAQLRIYYDGDQLRVLSRNYPSNKKEFKVNELLFDITVCAIKETSSTKIGIDLFYIMEAIWQIESELEDGDYREALTDFNNLIEPSMLKRSPKRSQLR
jgi:hypothetical protein